MLISARTQRYLLTGMLTIIPIWVTWLIFSFILRQLSRAGSPGVRALTSLLDRIEPGLSEALITPWTQTFLAILLTLLMLYLLGWAANLVVGRRLIGLFDRMMHTIPLVQQIYGATKQLLTALQHKPDGVQRVVLIEFPSPEMKTVGFVTRVMKDRATGDELAAVYVPTTPNPTSGYLEIVPIAKLVDTDWSMEEAMRFIVSGGAVAPGELDYSKSADKGKLVKAAAEATAQSGMGDARTEGG